MLLPVRTTDASVNKARAVALRSHKAQSSVLHDRCRSQKETPKSFEHVCPVLNVEVRPKVSCILTQSKVRDFTSPFERFSTWMSLVRAIAFLIHIACSHKSAGRCGECRGWHRCHNHRTPEELSLTKRTIIVAVQRETFSAELAPLDNEETCI